MTYEEIAWMAWEMLGEPTDLNPDAVPVNVNSPYATNEERWIFMLNRAQDAIATFKSGNGRMFRYKNDSTLVAFELPQLDKTLTAAAAVGARTLQFASTAEGDNFYAGWVVCADENNPENAYRVLGSDDNATNITLYLDYPVRRGFANGATLKMANTNVNLRGNDLSGTPQAERVFEVLDTKVVMFDEDNASESTTVQLNPLPRVGLNQLTDYFGVPGYWNRQGNTLRLDRVNPIDTTYVYVDIKRMPTERTLFTEEPDIPEQFHYAMVLWVVGWGQTRASDYEARKDYRGQLREFMETTMTDYMVEFERNGRIGGKVRMN